MTMTNSNNDIDVDLINNNDNLQENANEFENEQKNDESKKINSLKNLVPFSSKDRARAAEFGRLGGKISQKRAKEKKNMKECMQYLMRLNVKSKKSKQILQDLGIKNKEQTNAMLVAVSMLQQAIKGNVKAAEFCRDTASDEANTISADVIESSNDNIATINLMLSNPPKERKLEDFEEENS